MDPVKIQISMAIATEVIDSPLQSFINVPVTSSTKIFFYATLPVGLALEIVILDDCFSFLLRLMGSFSKYLNENQDMKHKLV